QSRSVRAGPSHCHALEWRQDRGLYGCIAQIHGWFDRFTDPYRGRRENALEGYLCQGAIESSLVAPEGLAANQTHDWRPMNKHNRRAFLQTAALAAGFNAVGAVAESALVSTGLKAPPDQVAQRAPTVAANEGKKPLRLGLILGMAKDPDG